MRKKFKLDAQQKRETIVVLKTYIKYLENNLTSSKNWLCLMNLDISKVDKDGITIECGFNDRMIPLTVAYIKDEKPYSKKNVEHYNSVNYVKGHKRYHDAWWRYSSHDRSEGNITTNIDKIRFLKHLINKLKN